MVGVFFLRACFSGVLKGKVRCCCRFSWRALEIELGGKARRGGGQDLEKNNIS